MAFSASALLGALFQFLFFSATSLLLFFERHFQFLLLQALFLTLQIGLTALTVKMGTSYYGLGIFACVVISGVLSLAVLERTMKNLTFLTFSYLSGRTYGLRDILGRRELSRIASRSEWSNIMYHNRVSKSSPFATLVSLTAIAALAGALSAKAQDSGRGQARARPRTPLHQHDRRIRRRGRRSVPEID